MDRGRVLWGLRMGREEVVGRREGQVFQGGHVQGTCAGSLARGDGLGKAVSVARELSGGAEEPGLESWLSLSKPRILDASLPLSMAAISFSHWWLPDHVSFLQHCPASLGG